MRIALLVTLAVMVPVRAEADAARAWTVARSHLPAKTAVVLGVDLERASASSMVSLGLPLLLSQKPPIKAAFDALKAGCRVDPMKAIDGAVMGSDKEQTAGAIFIAVDGVDEATLVSCAEVIAKKHDPKNPTVTVQKDGAISSITHGGTTIHVAWLAKDVIAFAIPPDSKETLRAWTGGKGAFTRSAVGKLAAKVDTKAAVWTATTAERDLQGNKVKTARGSFDLAAGKVRLDVHLVSASKKEAAELAKQLNDSISQIMMNGGVDASVLEALKAASVTASGTETRIAGAIAEADLMAMLAAQMRGP